MQKELKATNWKSLLMDRLPTKQELTDILQCLVDTESTIEELEEEKTSLEEQVRDAWKEALTQRECNRCHRLTLITEDGYCSRSCELGYPPGLLEKPTVINPQLRLSIWL